MANINTKVSQGSLNRMLKYFRNKYVSIYYEHQDEMGNNWFESIVCKYDRFELKSLPCEYTSDTYFIIKIYENDELMFELELYAHTSEFYGLGRIKILNDGPYCYLVINKIKWWQRFIKIGLVTR